MNNLFTYVSTITRAPENEFIVERNIVNELIEDDGVVTQYSDQIVKFINGVTIKQSIEKDVNLRIQKWFVKNQLSIMTFYLSLNIMA